LAQRSGWRAGGYADTSTTVTLRSHLAMMLRMNPSGYFDAVNGTTQAALNRVYYSANTTYHVRILADVPARRYSLWVRPPGGSEILVADRYAFRSDAPLELQEEIRHPSCAHFLWQQCSLQ
jgi:unsaturated chondroitin disaccharide hydrolase